MFLPSIELRIGNEGCIMQWASILASPGLLHRAAQGRWDVISDNPQCTNKVITLVAIRFNDTLPNAQRQELWALLPRINEARRTSKDQRVNVRLAIWSAESVFHLVPKGKRQKARKAIDSAKAWLDGGGGSLSLAAAHASTTDTTAADATTSSRVEWFSRLLDAYEKACAEEGVLHELEDALCFVGSQMVGS